MRTRVCPARDELAVATRALTSKIWWWGWGRGWGWGCVKSGGRGGGAVDPLKVQRARKRPNARHTHGCGLRTEWHAPIGKTISRCRCSSGWKKRDAERSCGRPRPTHPRLVRAHQKKIKTHTPSSLYLGLRVRDVHRKGVAGHGLAGELDHGGWVVLVRGAVDRKTETDTERDRVFSLLTTVVVVTL